VVDRKFEIEFFRDFSATAELVKSGVMRIRLENGVVDYDILTAWSKRYGRPKITIRRNTSRMREGDESPETSAGALLMFNGDFSRYRSNETAPRYLVMEDMATSFVYWWEEIEHAFSGERIAPPDAFRLVRCTGANSATTPPTVASSDRMQSRCQDDYALYRATTNAQYEIEFLRRLNTPNNNRAGVVRYRGQKHVFEYEFSIVWSTGALPRPSLMIIRNSSAPRNPEEDDNEILQPVGPIAHMMGFGPGFGGDRGTVWSPYLVFPDFTVSFREWFTDLAKHPAVPPPEAWKLVSCSSDRTKRFR